MLILTNTEIHNLLDFPINAQHKRYTKNKRIFFTVIDNNFNLNNIYNLITMY